MSDDKNDKSFSSSDENDTYDEYSDDDIKKKTNEISSIYESANNIQNIPELKNLQNILELKTVFIKEYNDHNGYMTDFIDIKKLNVESKIIINNKKIIIKTKYKNFKLSYLILITTTKPMNIPNKEKENMYKYPIHILMGNSKYIDDPNSFSSTVLINNIKKYDYIFPFRTCNEYEQKLFSNINIKFRKENKESIYYKIMNHDNFENKTIVIKIPSIIQLSYSFDYYYFD